jgi:hypothetical protein
VKNLEAAREEDVASRSMCLCDSADENDLRPDDDLSHLDDEKEIILPN